MRHARQSIRAWLERRHDPPLLTWVIAAEVVIFALARGQILDRSAAVALILICIALGVHQIVRSENFQRPSRLAKTIDPKE